MLIAIKTNLHQISASSMAVFLSLFQEMVFLDSLQSSGKNYIVLIQVRLSLLLPEHKTSLSD